MVANLATERTTLTGQVWKFVLEELKNELAAFKTAKDGLDKAITSMTTQIAEATADKVQKAAEIRALEKQTTSIQPTIDGINSLLSSFGFQGFKLAKAASGNAYKLVRSDGSDAKATLSEGEKTFVTFLYFYHLLKGSEYETGITTDRIVVFDDPVSSLDSDILFIVGSLIKGLFDEVRSGTGHIKQIFVLTHNVYFHKEVTYNSKRKDVAMNEETFWIVRKPGLISKLDKHPTNPIKTSYELLWAEVRKPERSNLAIQNTLRRILENYFKILGGIEFEDLCAMFDGKEKLICKSLCSWVHDGSHYAHDDLYVSIDDGMVDSYLKVFRAIFEKSKHGAHYKMMMGDAYVEAPAAVTASEEDSLATPSLTP
jgi:wobble nucleotide-excising tRNase